MKKKSGYKPSSDYAPCYATLNHRLFAAMIDIVIELTVFITLLRLGGWYLVEAVQPATFFSLFIMGYGLFVVIQGHTLNRYGQTLGKRLLNIRIETLDGHQAGFWHIIGLRNLVKVLFVFTPVIGSWLNVGNALFLFLPTRRCLHDRLARTQVCVVGEREVSLG